MQLMVIFWLIKIGNKSYLIDLSQNGAPDDYSAYFSYNSSGVVINYGDNVKGRTYQLFAKP